MKDEKPEIREDSPWVTVARYSEIGFMVPAAVIAGYLVGLAADRVLHTHWVSLLGIILGAVAGFVAMIRRALQASADAEAVEAATCDAATTGGPAGAAPTNAQNNDVADAVQHADERGSAA